MTGWLTFTIVAVGLAVGPQAPRGESDFEQYVTEIRASGMTNRAAMDLHMAAAILSNGTIFAVKRMPDNSLGRSYTGALCFLPGADPEKTRPLREKIEAKEEAWLAFFKKQADTDGSGFVSTREGGAMRRRVELGLFATQVPEIGTVDELAEAVHSERAEVVEDLKTYSRLRAQSMRQGMDDMPALPDRLSQGG